MRNSRGNPGAPHSDYPGLRGFANPGLRHAQRDPHHKIPSKMSLFIYKSIQKQRERLRATTELCGPRGTLLRVRAGCAERYFTVMNNCVNLKSEAGSRKQPASSKLLPLFPQASPHFFQKFGNKRWEHDHPQN